MHTLASLFINIHLCKIYIDRTFSLEETQYLFAESTQVQNGGKPEKIQTF